MDHSYPQSPDGLDDKLSDAFINVENSIKSFHALLDSQNRQDLNDPLLSEEDRKSRLVAAVALRDSATIYLDWGWHYLNKLYEVPNPHNPEEDYLV